LLFALSLFALAALGQTEVGQPSLAVLRFIGTTSVAAASTQAPQPPPPTIASAVDREISAVEKQIVEVAEAMPEDKFNFSPESLNIPGSDYKGGAHVCRGGQACRRFQLFPVVAAYRR
jgi:hypothetical protein